MAGADNYLPVTSTDGHGFEIDKTPVPMWHRRDHFAEAPKPFFIAFKRRVIEPCATIKLQAFGGRVLSRVASHQLTHEKFFSRHPKLAIMLFANPSS